MAYQLSASWIALTSYYGWPCQENIPDSYNSAILFCHGSLGLGLHPIMVPVIDCQRVVYPNGFWRMDFKASLLQLSDNPTQWTACICTWEDIFCHKQTPNEIFPLPGSTQPSNLKEEDAIILQHVTNLGQEWLKFPHTNMLCHFQTCDFVEFHVWYITVV